MFPPERGKPISAVSERWLRTTFNDRPLFHASIFCQLTRNKVFLSPKPESREHVQCYTETIRGVHQKFQDNTTSCADENILVGVFPSLPRSKSTTKIYRITKPGSIKHPTATQCLRRSTGNRRGSLKRACENADTAWRCRQNRFAWIGPSHLHGKLGPVLAVRNDTDGRYSGDIILATQNNAKPLLPFVPCMTMLSDH